VSRRKGYDRQTNKGRTLQVIATSLKWRAPDKPVRLNPDQLAKFDNGIYLAQKKMDGYRVEIITDSAGHVSTISRAQKHIPVSQHILDEIQELGLPPLSQLDGEWMKRRAGNIEKISLFDVLNWDNKWVGSIKCEDRIKILDKITATEHIEIL